MEELQKHPELGTSTEIQKDNGKVKQKEYHLFTERYRMSWNNCPIYDLYHHFIYCFWKINDSTSFSSWFSLSGEIIAMLRSHRQTVDFYFYFLTSSHKSLQRHSFIFTPCAYTDLIAPAPICAKIIVPAKPKAHQSMSLLKLLKYPVLIWSLIELHPMVSNQRMWLGFFLTTISF